MHAQLEASQQLGDEAWAGDRTSTLCLVGRNLDATKLRARFGACLATAENYRRIVEGLRFKIGDAVDNIYI